MKFNLLPVGIGDVLVFHRCLQTLSLLFLQEAIEDGVGSLELRVRENVYGHGRRKPALNRCFSGHIRIAAVHVTTFRPDVHEIAFQDFSDLFLRQCQKVGHINSSTRERTFGSCVTKSPWLEQFFSGSERQSTFPVRPWTTKEPKETWHHSKKAKRTTWRAREKERKKLGACVLGSSMKAAVELAYCLETSVQPVSCTFQHPWTQRCSVFQRALSLSRSSTRNACKQPVQLHREPHQLTGWVGAVNRETKWNQMKDT